MTGSERPTRKYGNSEYSPGGDWGSLWLYHIGSGSLGTRNATIG